MKIVLGDNRNDILLKFRKIRNLNFSKLLTIPLMIVLAHINNKAHINKQVADSTWFPKLTDGSE